MGPGSVGQILFRKMLISHKHKFVTVDIPKTGSRSLRETFYPLNVIDVVGPPNPEDNFYQHATAEMIKAGFEKFKWNWNDYIKLTIVRDPWDRMYSHFNYLKNQRELKKCKDWKSWDQATVHQIQSADNFFKRYPDDRTAFKKLLDNHPSQQQYICENETLIVDKIYRFENIVTIFDEIKNICNIAHDITIAHANKGSYRSKSSELYDDELVDIVAKKEKYIIDMFGYSYTY